MNQNEIAISDQDFTKMNIIAKKAAECGLYSGSGGEAKIFMILLSASEMGVKPMEALNGGIWNIQGKIEISARLMSKMIRLRGHSIKTVQCDEQVCILEGRRSDNGDTMQASFSIKDAIKAGLANRDVWKKYTEDMLYSRALSRLARRLFSDVVGQAYVEGEIRGECEIISSNADLEQVKQIELTDEQTNKIKEDFLINYLESEHEDIRSYTDIYMSHHKKSLEETISTFENDSEKFKSNLNRWIEKRKQKIENEN